MPRRWISRRCARSIGSTSSPVASITRVAGQRLGELPVGVHAARAARSRSAGGTAARPGTPTAPCSWPGWSTSTHRKRVSLTACLSPRGGRPDGRGDEHLLAAVGVPRGERRAAPRSQLASTGLSAGEEVVGAPAGGDLQPAVAPGAGGELHQPVGVLVQHPELQRAVALRARARPAKTRPSASRTRQRSPSRCALGAVRCGSGGGCGHRILPAQVWARRPSVPLAARARRRCVR